MRRALLVTTAAGAFAAANVVAQGPAVADSLEARVWLDRGDEPVVRRGEEVRVYYRTSADAYSAIFRIDTDGEISMVFPQHPGVDPVVGGGRDYRLLFPDAPRWRVEEDPGVGYFFMVASPEPLDLSAFDFDPDRGWDLGGVGAVVYEDPYVAIDDYVAAIIPEWEVVPYALDFLSYSVGDTHTYPRFLCYDCHGFQPYARWNPYDYPCTSYQVVIWDDPYFYPRYRYSGTRVLVARAFGPRPRYGLTRRVAGAGWAPLVRTRVAPPRRQVVAYKESARAPSFAPRNPVRRGPRAVVPPRAAERPTLQRRPSSPSARLPARTPASGARGEDVRRPAGARAVPPPRPGGAAGSGIGTTTRQPPAGGNPATRAPARRVRPSGAATAPRAAPTRAPVRAVPGRTTPGAGPRAATSRTPARAPGAGSRPATAVRPPAARGPAAAPTRQPPRATTRPPSTGRPAASARPPSRPTPTRPGGRGGAPTRRRPGG
jgi:hypothetical protein